ncbi:MAG: gliding motility-associated C-terminal domain-containing protein [Flavobacteriales bacterium]|nr:gliding motility-associated C-terminal domain-containing protein [Flavobacteriales bacterium]
MKTVGGIPRLSAALLALACAGAGCEKEDPSPSPGGPPLPDHLEISVDSACVQAPNVFTPNGDGMNDRFFVTFTNITEIHVQIRNATGDLVFAYHDLFGYWDGEDSTGTGPYSVGVHALTTSGITLTGAASLTRLSYGSAPCLSFHGNPVCGDQFDPRTCGPVYDTNEVFCP